MTTKAKATVESTAKRLTSTLEAKDIDTTETDLQQDTDLSDKVEEGKETYVEVCAINDAYKVIETQGFVCPTCMTTFQSSEYLESHFQGVHGNICPVCMVGFNGIAKLQEHYEAEHEAVKPILKENQLQKLFGQITKRERTSSRISTDSNEIPASISENGEIEGNFCPVCMKQFDNPEDLGKHYETDHLNEKETLREKILASQFMKTMKSIKLKEKISLIGSSEQVEPEISVEDESFLYKNQIAALEESKALLVSEVVMLRKQVGIKESNVSNEELLDMKVDDLKLAASDDSEFVNLCIQKLSILDDKTTKYKNASTMLEEQLRRIREEQKALIAKYEESLLEKKELVNSYDTLIRFKDKQLEDMKAKIQEVDIKSASAVEHEEIFVEDKKEENQHQTEGDCSNNDKQIEEDMTKEISSKKEAE